MAAHLRRRLPALLARAARSSVAIAQRELATPSILESCVPAASPFLMDKMTGGPSIPPTAQRGFAASAAAASKSKIARRGPDGRQEPHGGKLVNLMVTDQKEKEELLASCKGVKMDLNERQSCDVEVLAVGGFSPLEGFMTEDVYNYVVDNMRLPGSDLLFGLPVVMDTFDPSIQVGQRVALHYHGEVLAVMEVESKWQPDKVKETFKCYGSSSLEHPGTLMVATERGPWYIGGKVWGFTIPRRVFPCKTPAEVRAELAPHIDVVAFQCRNPVHRAHYELFSRSLFAENVGEDGIVLVHPTCGPTQADDVPGPVRYETYLVLKEEKHDPRVQWAYLPYSMHMAGPREAIQHMILRKNYGCTHFIIGRDMAGSKSSRTGDDFYGPYDAQDFAKLHSAELGMDTVPSLNLVYTEEEGYVTADVATEKGYHLKKLSGTEFRRKLRAGEDIPEWFAFKSVVEVLRKHIDDKA
ncbi:hypothetical protein CLOM_g15036 [Closterium sp. NIES-68]|nr:hypothetical protein CLOM_g15036 [Closterium sp. NIES-68]GJP72265.1 hypothetical protein CLOP_g3014 [Closterium sp. NIES-67]